MLIIDPFTNGTLLSECDGVAVTPRGHARRPTPDVPASGWIDLPERKDSSEEGYDHLFRWKFPYPLLQHETAARGLVKRSTPAENHWLFRLCSTKVIVSRNLPV